MRRVRALRTLQVLTSGAVLAPVLFVASLYAIGRFVFVAKVVENMPPLFDLAAAARFFASAFAHTEFLVQALVVFAGMAFLWVVRDVLRVTTHYRIA